MVLLKELNHRVKNNMQMLQSLLSAARRETHSTEARNVLADATRRVAAMAAAQQVLYEESRPTSFEAKDFLQSVCATSQNSFDGSTGIVIEEATGVLSNDAAMPLALILNELLTNAVKHGANGGSPIRVGLNSGGESSCLWVQDSGPGFDLSSAMHKRSSGLGLVGGLARQLSGTVAVERGKGARCVVKFRQAMPT
jgi:two-component sensor histidine kinase